jgi:hypothetical protein
MAVLINLTSGQKMCGVVEVELHRPLALATHSVCLSWRTEPLVPTGYSEWILASKTKEMKA